MKGENKDSWKKRKWYLFAICGVLGVSGMVYAGNRTNIEEKQKTPLVDLNEEPEEKIVAKKDVEQDPIQLTEVEDEPAAEIKPETSEPEAEKPQETGEEQAQEPDGVTTAEGTDTPEEPAQTAKVEEPPEADELPAEETAQVSSPKAEDLTFSEEEGLIWPLSGNVVKNYSAEEMVYFETLQQFRTNPAIFIAGEKGAQIVAAADGIVSEIRREDKLGQVLVLDIGNGYQLVYGQLEGMQVKAGDYVKAGDPIARLAAVTKYYQLEGNHLYFQVQKEEATVNPLTLIK